MVDRYLASPQKESTTGEGHTHIVTFNFENPDPPVHY